MAKSSSPAESGGELRWNPLLLRWCVIAPSRARRPKDHDLDGVGATDSSADCPFCPGHEEQIPPVAWQDRDGEDWAVRAVPNRFPAIGGEEGYQEVLVESRRHSDDLHTMPDDALEGVVQAYVQRYRALCDRPGVARVHLFRNRGARAGTSLRHPHAQLIATALDPPEVLARERAFRDLRLAGGSTTPCPICDPSAVEEAHESRIVHLDEHLRAWVPRAADAPFEVWIAPVRHTPDFRDVSPDEVHALGRLLGRVGRALHADAGDPDYNLLLHTSGPRDPDPSLLHWWLRLRPRVGVDAGLELLSGIRVNPSSPEADAELLRESLGGPSGTPRL